MSLRGSIGLIGALGTLAVVAAPALPASARAPDSCPENASTEFFANPAVKKRPKSLEPTGVRTPAACSFPKLSTALDAANGVGGTAVATGAKRREPAVFKKEAYPLEVDPGTVVTTTDAPAFGGVALNPANYVVSYKSNSAPQAVTLAGGATIRGLLLRNARREDGEDMVGCASGGVEVTTVALDGKSKAGGKLANGLHATDTCSGSFSGVTARRFSENGLLTETTGDTLHFSDSAFTKNGNGALIHLGTVEMIDSHADSNKHDGIAVGTSPVSNPPPPAILDMHGNGSVDGNGETGIDQGPRGEIQLDGVQPPSSIPAMSVEDNGEVGLAIRGAAEVFYVSVKSNGSDGVVIDNGNDEGLINFIEPEIGGNGGNGISVPQAVGDGLLIQGGSSIGNDGDGMNVGGSGGGAGVGAEVQGLELSENDVGLKFEENEGVVVLLQGVDVHDNTGNGAVFEPSSPVFDGGNKFHSNGLNQVVFDGGGRDYPFTMDSGDCAFANSVTDYADGGFGIVARNQSNVTVAHTEFEGGGTGLNDSSAETGSSISISNVCN